MINAVAKNTPGAHIVVFKCLFIMKLNLCSEWAFSSLRQEMFEMSLYVIYFYVWQYYKFSGLKQTHIILVSVS